MVETIWRVASLGPGPLITRQVHILPLTRYQRLHTNPHNATKNPTTIITTHKTNLFPHEQYMHIPQQTILKWHPLPNRQINGYPTPIQHLHHPTGRTFHPTTYGNDGMDPHHHCVLWQENGSTPHPCLSTPPLAPGCPRHGFSGLGWCYGLPWWSQVHRSCLPHPQHYRLPRGGRGDTGEAWWRTYEAIPPAGGASKHPKRPNFPVYLWHRAMGDQHSLHGKLPTPCEPIPPPRRSPTVQSSEKGVLAKSLPHIESPPILRIFPHIQPHHIFLPSNYPPSPHHDYQYYLLILANQTELTLVENSHSILFYQYTIMLHLLRKLV